jgi:hypothetical protein
LCQIVSWQIQYGCRSCQLTHRLSGRTCPAEFRISIGFCQSPACLNATQPVPLRKETVISR